MGKNVSSIIKSLMAVAFATTVLSSCGNKNDSNKVTFTYHYSETESVTKKYKIGTEVQLEQAKQKTEYNFVGWFNEYFDDNYSNKGSIVADKNYDFYARYAKEGQASLIYHANFEGQGLTAKHYDVALNSATSVIENPFTNEGYYFIGWNTKRDATGTMVYTNSGARSITVNDNLVLYAVWNKNYTNEDANYYIEIHSNVIGLGAAVLVDENGNRKEGFFNSTTGEFEFYYDTGDIAGKINGDSFIIRNEKENGTFAYYNHNTNTASGAYYLAMDGYGYAIIMQYDSATGGLQTIYNGHYVFNKEYDDYTLYLESNNVPTGETLVYRLIDYTGIEGIKGLFDINDGLYGSYNLYDGKSLYQTSIYLDGYGNASFKESSSSTPVVGKYVFINEYEIEFRVNGVKSFTFEISSTEVSGQTIYFFMVKDEEVAGTYYLEGNENNYPKLVLDGYIYATYYYDEESYDEGYYIMDGTTAKVVFVLESGNSENSFVLDTTNQIFNFVNGGFAIVDGVLTSYMGTSAIIVIPDEVTSIAEKAFYMNSFMRSVTIPSSVTSIGKWAFENDHTLKQIIVLGTTPATLGEAPFRWPSADFRIIVPNGYENTYRNAEGWSEYADYITSAAEEANRPEFEITDGVLTRFNKKDSTDFDNFVIPAEVTKINNKVFAAISEITNIDLNNVIEVGEQTFANCYSLTQVTATNLKVIGKDAFVNCNKLPSISLPAIVTISETAFAGCSALKAVTLGENITSIEAGAFSECAIDTYIDEEGVEQERNDRLFVTFTGEVPPKMGEKVFYGTTAKLVLDSIETAINFFNNGEGWRNYINYIWINSGSEKGNYVCTENLLPVRVDGRMEMFDFYVYFYGIDGSNVTLYQYDKDNDCLVSLSGTYDGSNFIIGSGDDALTLVKEGTVLNYTNGTETLSINTTFEATNNGYKYNVKFNGNDVVLYVTYGGVMQFEYNNSIYTISLGTNTFTYTVKPVPFEKTFTSKDGSEIIITYNGSTYKVTGTLKGIKKADGSDFVLGNYTYATYLGDNTYTFSLSNLGYSYQVTAVANNDSFTYSFTGTKTINLKGTDGELVTVKVDLEGNIVSAVLSFKDDGSTYIGNTVGTLTGDYYTFNVNFQIDVVDSETGTTIKQDSPRNGEYHVVIDLVNNTVSIEKVS